MEAVREIMRLRPNMSREEFVTPLTHNFRHTEEDLCEIGLEVGECICGQIGCPGWHLRKTNEFSMRKFNEAFAL